MFDCHGTLDLYCWDGGKTWVVGGEPRGEGRRNLRATAQVAEALVGEMKPGARPSGLQAKGRELYRKAGVADPDAAVVFFHGLGLSHMDVEQTTADWRFEAGMVFAFNIDLLDPNWRGGKTGCVFAETIEITPTGARRMHSFPTEFQRVAH